MALTYNKNIRDLSIKGTITLVTGEQIHLTADDIISYSFDSQIGSEGLPLGSAEASSFSLEISNVVRKNTPAQFDNAEVHMFVGIKNGNDYTYSDFGVWYVEDSSASEQSVSIQMSGYDALATRFEAVFVDDSKSYPTTIGDIAETVCLAAGIRLKSNSFPNAAVKVSKKPSWDKDTTLRDILSYCAVCAGGYVRIARNGQVEIVCFGDGNTYNIDADLYQTFELTSGTAFKFNAIEAMLTKDADEYSRFAVNTNTKANATNTIQIEYNPLLTKTIVQSIVTELTGIEMEAGTVVWGGDPSVQCTDYYNITTVDGTVRKIMVTGQSFTFDGGMSVTESCDLPPINSVSSPTYSTSTNMYDAKGNIKATRISGLDSKVIKATSGHFDSLTADTIESDSLTASLISALDLKAKKIDATSVDTDRLTTLVANIVEGTIKRLNAGAITTDELYAAFAQLVTLKAQSINASNILTDQFAAEFAKVTVLAAGSAEFDKATIKHLIAQAMNLEYGVAGQVFIKNLAVEYAQMIGATIGELCIKASDGNYYLMDVSPDGTVTATKTTVSSSEAKAGQTSGGKIILETSITAANLNAGNLLATYALINQIDAARIDVGQLFAREAFVDLLRTSKIVSDKSITMIVGEVSDAKSTANTAKTNAAAAQSTADTAKTNAAAAQSAANAAQTAANNALASASDLNRLTDIEVIEGTAVQSVRRSGEGIRVYSEFEPKQDLIYGDPYPGGGGKQLFDVANRTSTSTGVSLDSDDWVTLELDNTSGTSVAYKSYYTPPSSKIVAGKQYLAVIEVKEITGGYLLAVGTSTASNVGQFSTAVSVYDAGTTVKNVTARTDFSNCKTMLRTNFAVNAGANGKIVFRISILEDTTITASNFSYTPYQNFCPIEGRASLNTHACGKNLFDLNSSNVSPYTVAMNVDGNSVRLYTTKNTSYASLVGNTVNLKAGKTYTLSGKVTAIGVKSSMMYLCLRRKTNNVIMKSCVLTDVGAYSLSINPSEDTDVYVSVITTGATAEAGDITLTDIMLEESGSVTEYEPYNGVIYSLDFGKNLINPTYEGTASVSGISIERVEDNYYVLDGTCTANGVRTVSTLTLEPGTYTLSFNECGGSATNRGTGFGVGQLWDVANNEVLYVVRDNVRSVKCTITETKEVYIRLYYSIDVTYDSWKIGLQLERGHTATPYSAYSPDTLEQTGGAIYGATVDWHAGKLVSEYGFYTLTGADSENWRELSSDGKYYMSIGVIGALHTNYAMYGVCSHAPSANGMIDRTYLICALTSGNGLQVNYPSKWGVSTLAEWKAYLAAQYAAGTPVQVSYKLASPIEITLTPAIIKSLNGINTIYTDADDGRVEFGHELVDVVDSIVNPTSPSVGMLWLDRGMTPAVLKRWDGFGWETVNDASLIEYTQDALLEKQKQFEEEQDKLRIALKLDDDLKCVRVGRIDANDQYQTSEFRIDEGGAGVWVAGQNYSRFEADRALFGAAVIRKANDGGLVFDSLN